ncbi:hypothetical protein VTO42DRAFT_3029 [Malbranchea cinnamomea]
MSLLLTYPYTRSHVLLYRYISMYVYGRRSGVMGACVEFERVKRVQAAYCFMFQRDQINLSPCSIYHTLSPDFVSRRGAVEERVPMYYYSYTMDWHVGFSVSCRSVGNRDIAGNFFFPSFFTTSAQNASSDDGASK